MILLRNQNIEADYFKQLQYRATNVLAKWYYKIEAALLHRLENKLWRADAFLTVSAADHAHFKALYPKHQHYYIPSFTESYTTDSIPLGKGEYVLYQGNLGHPENHEAALYILKNIASKMPNTPFVLAGKAPQLSLINEAASLANVRIEADPDDASMNALIKDAHIHILITFQATGLKLKLLAAIHKGRFIVANPAMLVGTNLDKACTVANKPEEFIVIIQQLFQESFSEIHIADRKRILEQHYSQVDNALTIARIAFEKSAISSTS